MSNILTPLPARRPDLVIRPIGAGGRYVVKLPGTHDYFHLGEEEHFLLSQLDGQQDAQDVCVAFESRFDELLSAEDLDGFVEMAREQGFLQASEGRQPPGCANHSESPRIQGADAPRSPKRQSLLYWRKALFNPNPFFNWIEPRIRFFWTRGFLLFSAACILFAGGLVWMNPHALTTSFVSALRWETAVVAWVVMLAVVTLHEFAHGLTCKHYGGDVREIGFLLLFFMPCFYCNVSDAWLFREKSKRLWVTFAGGYFELFLWALAVFVWRVTMPDTLVNYLAFIVVVACGVQTVFNFNPLIRLDGYYLLSDWLEIPNLRQRSWKRFQAHARRLLWGGPRPPDDAVGRLLTAFGTVSWVYSVAFVGLMLLGMLHFWGTKWGLGGLAAVAVLGVMTTRNLLSGFSAGEVTNMIRLRHKRTAVWALVLAAVCGLAFLKVEDRATGPFILRSSTRAEVQAPVAGKLCQVYVDEGDCVTAGLVLARIEVPELSTRLAAKRAARDVEAARLALLEAGTRIEEIEAQRKRVEQATAARDLAARHLEQSRAAHAAESERMAQQIALAEAELKAAESNLTRADALRSENAFPAYAFDEAEAQRDVCRARLQQAIADQEAHEAAGVLEAEQELSDRERDHVEACAALTLLEADTRPEEIAAQQARLRQLEAEIAELEAIADRQTIVAPVSGIVMTPHLKDRIGQHLPQGSPICEVADADCLIVEIALTEDSVRRVEVQQAVRLRPRGLTSETPATHVLRIAPAAVSASVEQAGELPGTVTIACEVDSVDGRLRPGMTGRARIDTGRRTIAAIASDRVRHYLRTEFWW